MTAEASLVASSSSICADDGVVLVSNPSSPNLERQRRPGKKHLPKEAYGILKDYFFNVNRWPKKHERLELAAKVHTVPGSEGYTPKNIEGYFANLRKQHRQTSDVVVKREIVEAPLSLDADETAVNGATIAEDLSSISTAPKKKRKSRTTHVGESQATTSATSAQHPLSTASTEASLSGIVAPTHMGSPPSASSVPSTKTNQKKRNRIKVEGYKIINDFFTNVSRYPTASQKVELLAAVTSIKGCEGYTLEKLTGYFSRRRTERKEPVPFVKAESPESLSNAALYQDQGSPEAASLVVYPPSSLSLSEPEPAPEPDAHPASPAFHTSNILFLPPLVPPPHPPTPPAPQLSPFILFSNFEPYTPTLEAQPQPHNSPQPTAPDLATTRRSTVGSEPDPPRYPADGPAIPPSMPVDPDAPMSDAPTTSEGAETAATGTAVLATSDPIPNPSPRSATKPKPKSQTRALTDAALKVLDDYYANVTPNPSPSQCATLASQVSALPECGRCTAKQVRKYFKKRRVEERCEALKAERMGAGVDADGGQAEPVLVLVAVVEPKPNLKSDEPVRETSTSDINTIASDLPEASTPSLPALGGGRQESSEQLIEDILMDENHEPEDVVLHYPKSNQDGGCSDHHTQIPGKEEGMDAGVDPELVAEVEPNSNSKPDESGPEMSDVIVFTGDLVDASASSLPAFGGQDEDSSHQAVPDISMDDFPEIGEPEDVVLDYPNSDDDGECSDAHTQTPGKEERIGAGIEARVGHAERDLEEVEHNSNLNSDESGCEVVSDTFDTDLSKASPSSLPALGGEDECSSDEALREVSMDDVHESPKPEDAVLDSSEADQLEDDTPMDVDSDVSPAAVQVDVLGLATQLQRVFSKPATLDEGHPTTFADFAMWLQMRNVGLLCASG
ncbi:hypothetical protein LXA43DRAFT_1034874 [Ganoderma leucocontextum]|nr:hypothetical protein LXA43DRAFT_1034874 [Ganoderma leucocontextum]